MYILDEVYMNVIKKAYPAAFKASREFGLVGRMEKCIVYFVYLSTAVLGGWRMRPGQRWTAMLEVLANNCPWF